MVFHVSVLAQSRHLHVLAVSSFHVSSCLMTVSLSGIAKCLFCVETLASLAERRPLGHIYSLFTCLL